MDKVVKVPYRVIYGDTDCGGVVYYAHYLRLFEIGRTELLRQNGLTYRQIEREKGLILPVVESYVRYRSPARYDDVLEIETKIVALHRFKVRFDYVIYREEKPIVYGFTVHAPINKEGRLVKFPDDVYHHLEGLLVSSDFENQ